MKAKADSKQPPVSIHGEEHQVKVISIGHTTHNVLHLITEKPEDYNFTPGQATEVSINRNGWKKERRPFTFTCLPSDDFLEFNIKEYPSHLGVTNELHKLKKNDVLLLHEVFGAISYQGEGLFIAGGAGVTPFISIFRNLRSKNQIGNNKLIFANKTKSDIILEDEFKKMLGKNFINILSLEKINGYANGQITEEFLKENMKDGIKKIYLCGPPPMMEMIEKHLSNLHFDSKNLVKESF